MLRTSKSDFPIEANWKNSKAIAGIILMCNGKENLCLTLTTAEVRSVKFCKLEMGLSYTAKLN